MCLLSGLDRENLLTLYWAFDFASGFPPTFDPAGSLTLNSNRASLTTLLLKTLSPQFPQYTLPSLYPPFTLLLPFLALSQLYITYLFS